MVGTSGGHRGRRVAACITAALVAGLVAPISARAADPAIALTSFDADPTSLVVDGADGIALEDLRTILLPPTEGAGETTINSAALGRIALGRIDLQSSALGRIALGRIALGRIDLGDAAAVNQLLLSQIPLLDAPWESWDEFLVGTEFEGAPLQTVSLLQLLESPNTTTQARVAELDLDSLDLTGTLLDSLPVPSLLLATAPLQDVPVDVDLDGEPVYRTEAAWCGVLSARLDERGLDCRLDFGLDDGTPDNEGSLMSLALAGVPLDDLGLTRIPLEHLPDSGLEAATSPLDGIALSQGELQSSALGRIALGRIDLQSSALGRIALGRIALEGSALGRIALGRIDLQSSALGRIALGRIDLQSSALGRIALGRIDVDDESALAGIPLSSLAAPGTLVADTPFGPIPLTRSNIIGTPLGALPIASIGIAGTPLADIELAKVGPDSSLRSLLLTDLDIAPLGLTLGHVQPSTLFGPCGSVGVPSCARALAGRDLTGLTLGQLLDDLADPAASLGTSTIGAIIGGATPSGTLGELLAYPGAYTVDEEPLAGTLADLGLIIDELVGTLAELLRSPLAAALGIDDLGEIIDLIPDPDAAFGDSTLAELVLAFHEDDHGQDTLDVLLALLDDGYDVPGTLAELLVAVSGDIEDLDLLNDLLALVEPDADLGSLADLLRSLTGNTGLTLADLILFLLSPDEFDWESVALDADDIAAIKLGGERVRYTASITCDGACPTGHVLEVDLPTGFAFAGDVEGALAPEVDGQTLRFAVVLSATGDISFDVTPVLGDGAIATARLLDGLGATVGDPGGIDAAVDVASGPDPEPGTATSPRALVPDRMYLGALSSASDVHYWTIEVDTPGQRLSVFLGNLTQDYDLVLYGPETAGEPLRGAADDRTLPLDTNPVSLDPLGDAAGTEPREDLPLLDRDPYAIAAERQGDATRRSEVIETGPLEVGDYLVQVSGYNGAFTDVPYTLRGDIANPPAIGECTARDWPAAPSTFEAGVTSVEPGDTTIFLVNRQRLAATFDDARADDVLAAIDAIDAMEPTEVMPEPPEVGVIAVDSIPTVNTKYIAWDTALNRCEPQAANDVVRAIGDALDTLAPDAEHLVVVGTDDIIPFSRVRDATSLANEQDYAQAFSGNNELASALARGYVLTDDPLADPRPTASADREVFVPEVGIGRLVETPEDITGALEDFVDREGLLDANSAFSSGYSFLTDGARAVAEALADPDGDDEDNRDLNSELVGDELAGSTWTDVHLRDLVFGQAPSGPYPDAADLLSLNAHFDHSRLLPGLGDAEGAEDELLTIADVAANLSGSLLFSMGCHSGLSVAASAGGADEEDWAETFVRNGALWVGNTGYGFGDTEAVALSEQLMTLFAQNLDGAEPVGDALAHAKQQYLADLGVISPYDEKVLMQTTLFGLPMYQLKAPQPRPPVEHDPLTLLEVPGTDLQSAEVNPPEIEFTASPPDDLETTEDDDLPRYWSVDGRIQATQFRPIQPRLTVDVTPDDPTQVVRGALVTSLVSEDHDGTRPRVFRPVVHDDRQEAAPVIGESAFPAAIQSVSDFESRDGTRQQLVLIPGQFRSDGGELGVQRLYRSIGTVVYYGTPPAGPAPAPAIIEVADGAHVGESAAFTVRTDRPEADILRAYVLYTSAGTDGQWEGLDLEFQDGTWTGTELTTIEEGAELEYIVQVVTTDGLVSVTSNKGQFFEAPTPEAEGPIDFIPSSSSHGGWYRNPALTFTLDPVDVDGDGILQYSLDGEEFRTYTGPIPVTGEGLHRLRARVLGVPGSDSSLVVPVDTLDPDEEEPTPPLVVPAPVDGWNLTVPTVTFYRDDDVGSINSGADRISYTATGAQPIATPQFARADRISKLVSVEGITRFTYWSTDHAGNEGEERTFDVRYDATDPRITFAPPSFGSNLRATTSHGGSPKPATIYTPSGRPAANTPPCSQTVPWPCKEYTAQGDPILFGRVPTYLLNQSVTVGYECRDPLPGGSGFANASSGIRVCTGADVTTGAQAASGELTLSTATPGTKQIEITSRDVAGNEYRETFTYRVVYKIELLYDHTKGSKSGTTSPIKVKLRDANGVDVSSPSITLTALEFRGQGDATFPGGSNTGGVFRFVSKGNLYQFNAKPKISPNGTYSLAFMTSNDAQPSTQTTRFGGPWTPYRAEFRIG